MKRIGFFILVCIALTILAAPAWAQQRGGAFSAKVEKAVGGLDYHALVIGINRYSRNIPRLNTSVNDARAVKDLLISKYGFPAANVTELFDYKATRGNILRTLRELSITLDDNDALVIYFAGHGVEDIATSTGYWIPADATPNAYETYVSNGDIRTYLRAIKARHIFLVSDSCFSGTLLAQRAMPGEIDERFYARKAASRSRVVLTSGGKEPVMDSGHSGHSVFGYFFLKILRDYDRPYLIPTQIFVEVGPLVANNAPQTPQWGALRDAMDEGGEIVFVNRQYKAPAKLPPVVVVKEPVKKTPEKDDPPTMRTAAWICTGIAVAGIGTGAVFYVRSKDYHDSYTEADTEDDANDARSGGQTAQSISQAGFAVGIVSGAAATYFFLSGKDSSKSTWLGNFDFVYSQKDDVNQAAVLYRW